jgi:hypothetical protein
MQSGRSTECSSPSDLHMLQTIEVQDKTKSYKLELNSTLSFKLQGVNDKYATKRTSKFAQPLIFPNEYMENPNVNKVFTQCQNNGFSQEFMPNNEALFSDSQSKATSPKI